MERRQCTAHSTRTGERCKKVPIRGGYVCPTHGGSAPQVKQKAEERLKALIEPAITRLAELIAQKEFPSVAIAAVKDALDRNGALGKARESISAEVTHRMTLEDLVAGSIANSQNP
jgi:hypothetical protein